jgi:hypothetical protein
LDESLMEAVPVSTAGRIKGFSIVDRSRMSALLPKTTRVSRPKL